MYKFKNLYLNLKDISVYSVLNPNDSTFTVMISLLGQSTLKVEEVTEKQLMEFKQALYWSK